MPSLEKYKEIKCTWKNENTTLDLEMTPSQEKALEFAILKIWKNNQKTGHRRIKTMNIEITYYGTIILYLSSDNNKPGTFGYAYPTYNHLFIGKKGGYTCYTRKNTTRKSVKKNGWRALIYC